MNSNSNRNPLIINIGFLLNQPIGESRDISMAVPQLALSPELTLNDFKARLRLGRTPQGILAQMVCKATVPAECVRCLTEFQQVLKVSFKDLFAFDHRSVTESGLVIPESGNIDLTPLVREFSLLSIPIKPLCREDCKGLCIECGENLNFITCEHVKHSSELEH